MTAENDGKGAGDISSSAVYKELSVEKMAWKFTPLINVAGMFQPHGFVGCGVESGEETDAVLSMQQ